MWGVRVLRAAPCPQDPLTTVREHCEQTEKCVKARERLELCDARVSSRSDTEEQCTEELFDFLHARDHCVSALFGAELPSATLLTALPG